MQRGFRVVALGAAVIWAAGGGQAAAQQSGESKPLQIKIGGHDAAWQPHAGLADSRGAAFQALVLAVDGADAHPEAGAISGLEGQDTSALRRVGFTVAGEDAGIIPCIRVAFVDALGAERELMITTRMMRAAPSRTPGWTVYSLDGGLPPGGTITAVELGAHVESDPPDPIRLRFDDIVVNDELFTHAGDSGDQ